MLDERREKRKDGFRHRLDKLCDGFELVIAILVGLALLFTTVSYLLSALGVLNIMANTTWFLDFLKNMFNLVVGIEFIKMLLKPSAQHVVEVLVFLVTRYLIIEHSSAVGILCSVLCIILLYAFHFVMQYFKFRYKELSNALDSDKSDIGGVGHESLDEE